ncbi:uncharacterized protein LOC135387672 [Ornithodoros turicata]|uniref:uncharacterized protein LOC135387672 n=1 Tax=Ornithodoros turicata TaxID=34597 RepID=UPI0031392EB3
MSDQLRELYGSDYPSSDEATPKAKRAHGAIYNDHGHLTRPFPPASCADGSNITYPFDHSSDSSITSHQHIQSVSSDDLPVDIACSVSSLHAQYRQEFDSLCSGITDQELTETDSSYSLPTDDPSNESDAASHSDSGPGDSSSPHGLRTDPSVSEGNSTVTVHSSVTLAVQLALWAITCNTPQAHLSSLLQILKPYHPDLPCDARTLLQTPRESKVSSLAGGDYFYVGIAQGLYALLRAGYLKTTSITLKINIDGIPISKSSTLSLWPILIHVKESASKTPFLAAAYIGKTKPSSAQEFLRHFVCEVKQLMESGLCLHGKMLKVAIGCFICDLPARAFIKCITGHTGYYACERCELRGHHSKTHKKRLYMDASAAKRSWVSFRNQVQREHHKGTSPLVELDIDLIKCVPYDYMHLVCLGVMRTMIMQHWMSSKPQPAKLANATKELI